MRASNVVLATVLVMAVSLSPVGAEAAHADPSVQFVVAPDGDDAGAGTAADPFATPERAQQAVRDLAAIPTGGVDVLLREGRYELSDTLAFGPDDSGASGSPVRWSAWPGERPVLDGGRAIDGWSLYDADAGIWSAPADGLDFRQLYVDGLRATRARTAALAGSITTDDIGHITTDAAVLDWVEPSNVEAVYREIWTQPRNRVDSVSVSGADIRIAMEQPGWGYNRRKGGTMTDSAPVWFENDYSFLDEPGEWYLDRSADTLFYLPRGGETLSSASVVAPALERLLTVVGTADEPVHDLEFSGLEFTHSSWTDEFDDLGGLPDVQGGLLRLPEEGMDNKVAPTLVTPGAVLTSFATAVAFRGNRFTALGNAGLDIMRGSSDVTVEGNVIHDIAGSGIQIGEVDIADGSFVYDETSPFDTRNYAPSDTREVIRDIDVTGNAITRIGLDYASSVGVFVGYTQRVAIEHNEIVDVPYSGISLGWGWGQTQILQNSIAQDNLVADNLVSRAMTTLLDGGGIYTLGAQPGTVIEGNHLDEDVVGIYLDNGSSGMLVQDNVVAVNRPDSVVPLLVQREWPTPTSTGAFDNEVRDNFSAGIASFPNGVLPRTLGDNLLSGNVNIAVSGTWPATAEDIVRSAGLPPSSSALLPPAADLAVNSWTLLEGGAAGVPVELTLTVRLLRHLALTDSVVWYLDGGAALAGTTFEIDGGPAVVTLDSSGKAFFGTPIEVADAVEARGRNGASVTLQGELDPGDYTVRAGIGTMGSSGPSLAVLGAPSIASIEEATPFYQEDFSSTGVGGLPTGWTVAGTGGTASVQAATSAPGDHVLVIDHPTTTSASLLAGTTIPTQSGRLALDVSVRADQTDADGYGPWLRDSGDVHGPLIAFRANGTIAVNAAGAGWTSVVGYSAGEWYRLRLVVDVPANSFDLWVDGVRVAEGVPFRSAVTSLSKLQFGAYYANTGSFAFTDIVAASLG